MTREKMIILPKLNFTGKQWFVYFSYREPRTGKMKRFRLYDGFTGLSDDEKVIHAQNVIDEYSTKLRTGWDPFTDDVDIIYNDQTSYSNVAKLYGVKRSKNRTLRVWISKFIETLKPAVSNATFQTYQSKFRIFMQWCEQNNFEDNDITSIDNAIIHLFFKHLINVKKLSQKSIKGYGQIIKALFEFIKANKIIIINPVFNLPRTNRINDQAPRPIMRADMHTFKTELMKDTVLWLVVQLEYYCGLRPGHEIREMKIKDIDFSSGTIFVDRDRAKTRVQRIVTVPHQMLTELRAYFGPNNYNRELYAFGSTGIPGAKPLSKNTLRNRFNKIRTNLNMPKEYKFYSWKHTGAVEADEANIPAKDISLHLGHTSLQTTDAYFKNKKSRLSKAIRDNFPSI
jgi:integrase